MVKSRQSGGFTLLELLIVTAIIGLLASILIPNLIDALQKARQKRAMTDMRGVGIGWMSWQTDQSGAASAGQQVYPAGGLDDVTYAQLYEFLRPNNQFFYVQELPYADPWGNPYRFKKSAAGGSEAIFICASGRDKTFVDCELASIPIRGFLTTDYDQDIIWADGSFVRWPDGTM